MTLNLYNGKPQHENFCRMEDFYATRQMASSDQPHPFPSGDQVQLPATFEFEGSQRQSERFLAATDTSDLLIIHDGKICFEEYYLSGGEQVQWTSWSVAKSFVSALLGIAIDEGLITSVDEALSKYVPSLAGSAYEGVSIKNVLQMSSGARWNEDYSDRSSDIHQLGRTMAGDQSLSKFVGQIQNQTSPGTLCQYNSADTQALGMLLVAATGQTISQYMYEKISQPLGMESPGYWLLDSAGMEMALGGLNLTARDFAKIGELYRLDGVWGEKQIVPRDWVQQSIVSDAPHLRAGKVIVGGHTFPFGYGYQWWVPAGNDGEFSAIGVYNQFVYVDPKRKNVIVKLSANRRYGISSEEADNQEDTTLAFLRATSRQVG